MTPMEIIKRLLELPSEVSLNDIVNNPEHLTVIHEIHAAIHEAYKNMKAKE